MLRDESQMDKIRTLIAEYEALDRSEWSERTAGDHNNLAVLCQNIARLLGNELSLWHRLGNVHIEDYIHTRNFEDRQRDRRRATDQ